MLATILIYSLFSHLSSPLYSQSIFLYGPMHDKLVRSLRAKAEPENDLGLDISNFHFLQLNIISFLIEDLSIWVAHFHGCHKCHVSFSFFFFSFQFSFLPCYNSIDFLIILRPRAMNFCALLPKNLLVPILETLNK